MLLAIGFEARTRGSHLFFRRADVEEHLNLQRDGAKAKIYQVFQVRALIQPGSSQSTRSSSKSEPGAAPAAVVLAQSGATAHSQPPGRTE